MQGEIPVTKDGKKILLYSDQELVNHLKNNLGYRDPTKKELEAKGLIPESETKPTKSEKSKDIPTLLDIKDAKEVSENI